MTTRRTTAKRKRLNVSQPAVSQHSVPSNTHSNLVSPTYHGFINTAQDALLVFEACRAGSRKRVVRRLSDSERALFITSRAVFAWDEAESGIKRWTDGKHWSPSRINGSFLIYREVEPCAPLAGIAARGRASAAPPEYVVKENGLIKKAISITTADGRKQHLVSYYTREDLDAASPTDSPSASPDFGGLVLSPGVYPEFVQEVQSMSKGIDSAAVNGENVPHQQRPISPSYTSSSYASQPRTPPRYEQQVVSHGNVLPAPTSYARSPVHSQDYNRQHTNAFSGPPSPHHQPPRSPHYNTSYSIKSDSFAQAQGYSHEQPSRRTTYPSPYSDTAAAPQNQYRHEHSDSYSSCFHSDRYERTNAGQQDWEEGSRFLQYERGLPPSLPPLSALLRAAGVAAR